MLPGELVPGRSVARVSASRHPSFAEGDHVLLETGWRDWALSDGTGVQKLDARLGPLSSFLGVLGMPGLTAWAGVTRLLCLAEGETLAVSAAAGPVGSTAGQLAKILGARAIGLAGSDGKCSHAVGQFGFDACVNYKAEGWRDALAAALPEGLDCFFDNTGGELLEAAIGQLRPYGRVALCGLIAQYNSGVPYALPLAPVIGKRARLMGLVVYDHEGHYPEYLDLASGWLREGRLKLLEDRAQGLAAAPEAFQRLMSGQNFGKSLVVVHEEG